MTKRKDSSAFGRRGFLKAATIAGAGALATPLTAKAQSAAPAPTPAPAASSIPPTPDREAERGTPSDAMALTQSSSGGDFMVDVMRGLGIEHVAAFVGSSFRGIHESLINYGMLTEPQIDFLSCMHEEVSVAMCHGYAKIEGKPMAAMMHATVGLQHGSMAIYNAYADRVPIFLITPNRRRMSGRANRTVPFVHSVQDGAAIVRDFVKWDDQPASLQHWAESATRAWKYAMTPPYGPVLLVTSSDLQEGPIDDRPQPTMPQPPQIVPPQAEDGALREVAKPAGQCRGAGAGLRPRRAHAEAACDHMIELAELLQAPVVDGSMRMNFPWRHPLNQSSRGRAVIAQADVLLGMEMTDFWATTNSYVPHTEFSTRSFAKPGAQEDQPDRRSTSISIPTIRISSAIPMPIWRWKAMPKRALPALIEACQRLIDKETRATFDARGKKLGEAHLKALDDQRALAAEGWDSQPITTARLVMELYEHDQRRGLDARLGRAVPERCGRKSCGTADKHHRYIGDAGAYGIGYTAPATLGRGARQQEARAPHRVDPSRWRSDVLPQLALDRCA